MSVLHRNSNIPADPGATAPQQNLALPLVRPGICTAAVVVLPVSLLQNVHGVEVSFLWTHGSGGGP